MKKKKKKKESGRKKREIVAFVSTRTLTRVKITFSNKLCSVEGHIF